MRYVDLYPGIDLELQGEGGQFQPRLIVREVEALGQVQLQVEGAQAIQLLASEGTALPHRVQLETAAGTVYFPLLQVTYADTGTSVLTDMPSLRNSVINGPFASSTMPSTPKANATNGSGLLYSTFLGGEDTDTTPDIVLDVAGNAYITGFTTSTDFPTTPGAYDPTFSGETDVFITKLNTSGSDLLYSTFIGDTDYDRGPPKIAIDGENNVYITGNTESPNFPTTEGAYDTVHNGGLDVFVTKLNASGSDLLYSTLLGGDLHDNGRALVLDAANNVYVTGSTNSLGFPTTEGAYDTIHNGNTDVFVTKLNADGSDLIYSTFLGSPITDVGYAIALDDLNNVYVTGSTLAPSFPTTEGAYDTVHNGGMDVFIAKLNTSGSTFMYSTFLGGNLYDEGYDIVWDQAGIVYVAGYTRRCLQSG